MGLGFVQSFAYWTTNFAEVQRALSAKDMQIADLLSDWLRKQKLDGRGSH